jgi:ribosomal protein S25
MLSDRGGTTFRSELTVTANVKYLFEEIDEEEESEINDEDIVTPYSICNKTNVKLFVKRLNLHG